MHLLDTYIEILEFFLSIIPKEVFRFKVKNDIFLLQYADKMLKLSSLLFIIFYLAIIATM